MKKDGSQKRKNNRIAEIRVDHFFARTFGAIGTTNRREEAGASTDNSTTLQTLCERCTRKYHHADTPQPSAENYIPCLCLALLSSICDVFLRSRKPLMSPNQLDCHFWSPVPS